jgi:hypothetical protein
VPRGDAGEPISAAKQPSVGGDQTSGSHRHGREPVDLVIRSRSLVNVHTPEILESVDVAIKARRVTLVDTVAFCSVPLMV